MAYGKYKKGGQGGKLGRKSMNHWTDAIAIKHEYYRIERRKARQALKEYKGKCLRKD